MKLQYKNIALFATCIFVASCSNELLPNLPIDKGDSADKMEMTFSATVEGNTPSTRTTIDDLDNAYPHILWTEGDKINLFSGTTSNEFTLSSGKGTRSGKFSGTAAESSVYYALYPYNEANTISEEGVITTHVPAEQTVIEGTFNPECGLMMAKTDDKSEVLDFRHACGYILYTADFDCEKVVFRYEPADANMVADPVYIAGDVEIDWNEENPKATVIDNENASNSITITCPDGIKAGKSYLVAACPMNSMVHSLYVDVYVDGVKYTRINNASQSAPDNIRRAKIFKAELDLPNMNLCDDYEFVDLGLPSGTLWGTSYLEDLFYSWGYNYGSEYNPYSKDDPLHDTYRPTHNFSIDAYKFYTYDSESETVTDVKKYGADGLTSLELIEDAAHTRLGYGWTMPTTAQANELIDNCEWNITEMLVGKYELKVTGPNGNSIYFPLPGHCEVVDQLNLQSELLIWTKDLCQNESELGHSGEAYTRAHALYYDITDKTPCIKDYPRNFGLFIYPVHQGYTTYPKP